MVPSFLPKLEGPLVYDPRGSSAVCSALFRLQYLSHAAPRRLTSALLRPHMSRCSLMLAGLVVAAAFQATPISQLRFVARQSSTAHSDLQALKNSGWRYGQGNAS